MAMSMGDDRAVLAAHRHLIAFLARRKRRASIVDTVLGRLWYLITPIAEILIYWLLVVVIFGRGGDFQASAFLTIVTGIIHFGLLSQCFNQAVTAIVQQEKLLLQIRIDSIVFVGAAFTKTIQDSMAPLGVLAVTYVVFGLEFATWRLLAYPFVLLLLAVALWAGSLAIASSAVFLRDIKFGLPVGLRLMMYMMPVIYQVSFVPPRLQILMFLNPLATLFALLQWSLLATPLPPLWAMAWAVTASILAVIGAHRVHTRTSPRFTKAF